MSPHPHPDIAICDTRYRTHPELIRRRRAALEAQKAEFEAQRAIWDVPVDETLPRHASYVEERAQAEEIMEELSAMLAAQRSPTSAMACGAMGAQEGSEKGSSDKDGVEIGELQDFLNELHSETGLGSPDSQPPPAARGVRVVALKDFTDDLTDHPEQL